MNVNVSVIIPVYNCEKLLSRAIESVVNQPDFNNNELILVDDGSVDGSAAICDDYSKKHPNIKVIHQENSGVSVARNNGIKISTGKWICFIDSDDYILEDAFSKLMKYGEADIICAACDSNDIEQKGCRSCLEGGKYKTDEIQEQLIRILSSSNIFFYPCWAKLFKRDIIVENNVVFPKDRKFAEDMVFVFTYLRYCKTISVVDDEVYYYCVNNSNATSVIPKSFETFLFILNWKKDYFGGIDCDKESVYNWLESSFLFRSFFSVKSAATYLKCKEAVEYIKQILNNDTFCELYTNSDEYSSFKTKSDELLDRFIRKKKPLLIFLMFKLLSFKTKLFNK